MQRALMQYKNPANRPLVLEGFALPGVWIWWEQVPNALCASGAGQAAEQIPEPWRKEQAEKKKPSGTFTKEKQLESSYENAKKKSASEMEISVIFKRKKAFSDNPDHVCSALFIFFSSWAYFDTRKNDLDGHRCGGLSSGLQIHGEPYHDPMRRPMDEALYKHPAASGELVMSYEMYMTFYEKSAYRRVCLGKTWWRAAAIPRSTVSLWPGESRRSSAKTAIKQM